jgi:hypothetical protein
VIGANACSAQPIRVASAMTSHNLCDARFVSRVNPDRAYADQMRPLDGMGLVGPFLSYRVDDERREVRTRTIFGFSSRAVYVEGRGCTLVDDGDAPAPIPASAPSERARSAPLTTIRPKDPELIGVIDSAFAEKPGAPPHGTKAVVILRDGEIIAERYADAIGPQTKLPSWSMTKSLIATFVGALVQDGRLSLETPAPVAEWRAPRDPRGAIRIEHLLRMTSGLDVVEDNSGADPVSRFLYTEPDVTSAFRQAKLRATPGTEWAYTSANTWALSRIVEDATGGSPASLITWARARIFSPIGMDDVVLEFDAKGTPLGSSYSLATARDWARLGWLYANGGRVGTTQIIPATWPDWVATPTAGASKGYGAGFWTNRGDTPGARQRVAWGMPPDSYFALGFLGQYTVIIPSRRLVIVRIGDDHVADEDGRRIDSQGISRFVGAVVQHFDRAASP